MHLICLLGIQVAVGGKGGCDIDKYDYGTGMNVYSFVSR